MNENNADRDLASELQQETERKTPSADTVKSWNWGDDENTSSKPQAQETKAATQTQVQSNEANGSGNLTEQQIKNNAIASAAGVNMLTEMLSEAIISLRYHFKIDSEARQLLDDRLLDSDFDRLSEKEQFLVRRYQRLKKECSEKIARITKSEKARQRMEAAFEDSIRASGKVFLTPNSRLWMSISEDLIKSIVSAMTI